MEWHETVNCSFRDFGIIQKLEVNLFFFTTLHVKKQLHEIFPKPLCNLIFTAYYEYIKNDPYLDVSSRKKTFPYQTGDDVFLRRMYFKRIELILISTSQNFTQCKDKKKDEISKYLYIHLFFLSSRTFIGTRWTPAWFGIKETRVNLEMRLFTTFGDSRDI